MRVAAGIVCAILFCGAASAADAPDLTVAQFKASPPMGQTVHVLGVVVDTYICPPCPPPAECKPCMSDSSIFVADAPDAPRIAIATPDPARFERGKQYRFEIVAGDRARDGVDGRLLRSQLPDQGAVWAQP